MYLDSIAALGALGEALDSFQGLYVNVGRALVKGSKAWPKRCVALEIIPQDKRKGITYAFLRLECSSKTHWPFGGTEGRYEGNCNSTASTSQLALLLRSSLTVFI